MDRTYNKYGYSGKGSVNNANSSSINSFSSEKNAEASSRETEQNGVRSFRYEVLREDGRKSGGQFDPRHPNARDLIHTERQNIRSASSNTGLQIWRVVQL